MDFVGDDNDVMTMTDGCQLFQLSLIPHDAGRIVRVREYQHLATVVDEPFQAFKIHPISAAGLFYQRIIDHFAFVSQWCQTEGMVNGRLYDHFVARFGEDVEHHADALYYTRYV